MNKEVFRPETETKDPFPQKAERIVRDIQLVADGEKSTTYLEANGYSDLDELFLKETPAIAAEAPRDIADLGAENTILSAVEALSRDKERPGVGSEVLEKLAVYFQGLPSRAEEAERVMTAVTFLEKIPVDSSLNFLSELARGNSKMIRNWEQKSLNRGHHFIEEGKTPGEMREKYLVDSIEPAALRGAIRLKQSMGIELTEEEKKYYTEHKERF